METKIAVLKGSQIRKTLHNDQWWFSVADIVQALTDSPDPKQYIKKMRQRDSELNSNWGTICTPLDILAPDGKIRETNCANTEGIFSPPSHREHRGKGWVQFVHTLLINTDGGPQKVI